MIPALGPVAARRNTRQLSGITALSVLKKEGIKARRQLAHENLLRTNVCRKYLRTSHLHSAIFLLEKLVKLSLSTYVTRRYTRKRYYSFNSILIFIVLIKSIDLDLRNRDVYPNRLSKMSLKIDRDDI